MNIFLRRGNAVFNMPLLYSMVTPFTPVSWLWIVVKEILRFGSRGMSHRQTQTPESWCTA